MEKYSLASSMKKKIEELLLFSLVETKKLRGSESLKLLNLSYETQTF